MGTQGYRNFWKKLFSANKDRKKRSSDLYLKQDSITLLPYTYSFPSFGFEEIILFAPSGLLSSEDKLLQTPNEEENRS